MVSGDFRLLYSLFFIWLHFTVPTSFGFLSSSTGAWPGEEEQEDGQGEGRLSTDWFCLLQPFTHHFPHSYSFRFSYIFFFQVQVLGLGWGPGALPYPDTIPFHFTPSIPLISPIINP